MIDGRLNLNEADLAVRAIRAKPQLGAKNTTRQQQRHLSLYQVYVSNRV